MPEWGSAAPRRDESGGAAASSPVLQAAERLVSRIESLVSEVGALRAENASLRKELRDALTLFERAGSVASGNGALPATRGRKRIAAAPQRRRRRKATKGRATPPSVTSEVVRAVLAKLGTATASEIAKEITAAGAPVSGRAVRFLAERAGAQTLVGEDGQRRYRL
ncbi:MAG TPA: hypothetical protein VEY89_01830 [Candidatus Dormibacteraeota bacterium]|nr:hypothetical protein [Candidatus Dormibacteraeota bacterium]